MGNYCPSNATDVWTPQGQTCVSCQHNQAIDLTGNEKCIPATIGCNNQLVSVNGKQSCIDCPAPNQIAYLPGGQVVCINPSLSVPTLSSSVVGQGVINYTPSPANSNGFIFVISKSASLTPGNVVAINQSQPPFQLSGANTGGNQYYVSAASVGSNGQISQLSNVLPGPAPTKSYQQTDHCGSNTTQLVNSANQRFCLPCSNITINSPNGTPQCSSTSNCPSHYNIGVSMPSNNGTMTSCLNCPYPGTVKINAQGEVQCVNWGTTSYQQTCPSGSSSMKTNSGTKLCVNSSLTNPIITGQPSQGSFEISWSKVPQAVSYNIYQNATNIPSYQDLIGSISGPNHASFDLGFNYSVSANFSNGVTGGMSNIIYAQQQSIYANNPSYA
jgi:hypothetical protein